MTIQVVILAAGQGKRMNSDLPKVLHNLGGRPLLQHVIDTVLTIDANIIPFIIYGYLGQQLISAFPHYAINWIWQDQQLGTGHAVSQVLSQLDPAANILILYGDVPLLSINTLKRLINDTPAGAIGIVTAHFKNPYGYGRIKRNSSNLVTEIIEDKDATTDERQMTEVNSGIYYLPAKYLLEWVPGLTTKNAQGEYYLTEVIMQAVAAGISIHTVAPDSWQEILGVNDKQQLAVLERYYQQLQSENLLQQGAILLDPARCDIRGNVTCGRDVVIDINVIFEGRVELGDGCMVGANSILRNVRLGTRVKIQPFSLVDGAEIAHDCVIGPFARIRPDTELAAHVHVGNFVEIKQSKVNKNSKINHLSYIGDSEVGMRVNIGAGTITCNYDGVNKHKTIIGDDVFIGSAVQLVAPVTVGNGATIGAGSTITANAPPHQLTLARAIQCSKPMWQRPKKLPS